MSQALPMSSDRRLAAYYGQIGAGFLTARQHRQFNRTLLRWALRELGYLSHGATGERIRHPHPRSLAARGLTT